MSSIQQIEIHPKEMCTYIDSLLFILSYVSTDIKLNENL